MAGGGGCASDGGGHARRIDTYHVAHRCEDARLETLRRQPAHRHRRRAAPVRAVVVSQQQLTRQAEVGHLDVASLVHPALTGPHHHQHHHHLYLFIKQLHKNTVVDNT